MDSSLQVNPATLHPVKTFVFFVKFTILVFFLLNYPNRGQHYDKENRYLLPKCFLFLRNLHQPCFRAASPPRFRASKAREFSPTTFFSNFVRGRGFRKTHFFMLASVRSCVRKPFELELVNFASPKKVYSEKRVEFLKCVCFRLQLGQCVSREKGWRRKNCYLLSEQVFSL